MLDAVILLVYLLAVYLVAPVVAGASLIRLVFGWHSSRKDAVLAFIFALPQCILLHFGVNSTFWFFTKDTLLYVTLAATLLALIFWVRAIRRTDAQYILVEVAMVVIVPVILILSVDNWIAH